MFRDRPRDATQWADRRNLAPAADSPHLPHRVYNVGTGTEVSIRELLRATATAAGSDPDAVVAVPAPRRPGEVHRSCLDVRRSVAELGLGPPVPLVEGQSAQELGRQHQWAEAVADGRVRAAGERTGHGGGGQCRPCRHPAGVPLTLGPSAAFGDPYGTGRSAWVPVTGEQRVPAAAR